MCKRWKVSNKSVFNIGYHLIWCSKYRRKVLVRSIASRLEELLLEKAKNISVTIENVKIMDDHVHLFVKTDPTNSPHYIVQQFKGYTSRLLRKEFACLRSRLPTLWTRSYFCESVGCISEKTVKRYIENQKNQ
jgi:putative transposase